MNRIQEVELQLLRRRVRELELDVEAHQRRMAMWQRILDEWKQIATPEQMRLYRRYLFGD